MKNRKYYEAVLSMSYYLDGGLYWAVPPSNRVKAGDRCGNLSSNGYRVINISMDGIRKQLLEHRCIYYYFRKVLPPSIDHIDGDVSNNNISNLRECSKLQNQLNKKSIRGKSSRYKGVDFMKRSQKWRAQISIHGNKIYLGLHNSEIEAGIAYDNGVKKYRPNCKFSLLNFPEYGRSAVSQI